MRNGTLRDPSALAFGKSEEFLAYESLPPDLRAVVREAPFDVSVSNILANAAVMREIVLRGPDAGEWLREQFNRVYREKIMPQALKSA